MDKFLIVIVGPTGVGKTDVSVSVASYLNCEIISADSRQFYREMKIGTAVPSDDQLNLIRHHFVRFLSVNEYYSSSLFERDVLKRLGILFRENNFVIMTGGSGMYIDAVCNGIDDIPDIDPAVREKYNRKYREEGIESLRTCLRLVDPVHYKNVDLKNHKRIIRALEICESTGRPYSAFLTKRKIQRDFGTIMIGLELERTELYRRINNRVDRMIENGLEEEARQLYELRHLNALNSVGYSEFFDLFDGKATRENTVDLIKRNSRRYAKRQITWWGKNRDIVWFRPDQVDEIISFISQKTSS